MVEEFTKSFLDIARKCIPTKTITVRDYDKLWFTSEIRKEIRLRDRQGETGKCSSSNLDTKLNYLFNNSHFLSSSYTISSKCSSLIVFRSGGIQLLSLLDLISISIIFVELSNNILSRRQKM
jgi:hypothetical protein